jgi:hypothetical protein
VRIVIGGRPLGNAPIENVAVLPGRYQVVGAIGADTEVVEVDVAAGKREEVRLHLPHTTKVRPSTQH